MLKLRAGKSPKIFAYRLALIVAQLAAAIAAPTMGSGAVPSAQADGAPGANPGGNISGTVFQDFNANGVMNTTSDSVNPAIDVGVAGVTVQAYGYGSPSAVATATTNASGAYTLTGLTAGAAYRIEFSNLSAGFYASTRGASGSTSVPSNGTQVQFASGGTANVSLGINNPAHYSQANPRLITNAYVSGDQSGSQAVLFSHPYRSTVTDTEASANQIGTTWGLAYGSASGRLYAAAYVRRLSGLGPVASTNKTGQIYVVAPNGPGADNGAPFAVIPNAGADPHTDMNPLNADGDFDNGAFAAVGKRGLGDIELSDDERTLFAVNLNDRHLYSIDIALLAVTDHGAIPAPACNNGAARPFGLGFNNGVLYIGGVCDANAGTATHLSAYVYSHTISGGYSTAPLLTFALNYNRKCADTEISYLPSLDCDETTAVGADADWNPWTDAVSTIVTYTHFQSNTSSSTYGSYPQPMLTDIEFDRGDMVLGFRDRSGDMFGVGDPGPTQSNPLGKDLNYVAEGDLLRAGYNGNGTWTLENNSSSNPAGRFGPTAGAGTSSGPGGGEFYFQDATAYHDEPALGGVAQVPGFPDVVSTAMDPTRIFGGGTRIFSNISNHPGVTVTTSQGWLVSKTEVYFTGFPGPFSSGSYLGKSNGMGDIEAMVDAAPLEIGNRAWRDDNSDGIQDPGELGLNGVVVTLLNASGAPVTTTTTANGPDGTPGQYFFSLSAVDAALANTHGQSWTVRVCAGQPALNGYLIAPADSGNDLRDSDGNNAGLPATNNATQVTVNTFGPGANNHNLDFGFVPVGALGNYVWRDDNLDGIQNEPAVNGVNSVSATLYISVSGSFQPLASTVTANDALGRPGYYTFTNLISGTYQVVFNLTTVPTNTIVTSQDVLGGGESGDSDANPSTGATAPVALGPGAINPNVDMGLVPLPAGLGNYAWFDQNRDGFQDSSEPPVAGITVTLHRNGVAISTTLTNGIGFYQFIGLQPGVSYSVTFALPNGFAWTTQGANPSSDTDSNVNPAGASGTIVLVPGQLNATIDAGVIAPAIIDKIARASGPNGVLGDDTVVTFTLIVTNASAQVINNVVVSDPLASHLQYVAGSSVPTPTSTSPMVWTLPQIAAGASASILFRTRVNVTATNQVINKAYVLQGGRIVGVDVASVPVLPTVVGIDYLRASVAATGVRLNWGTALEINTLAFHVYRAETDDRAGAVRVTADPIASRTSAGADYEFVDISADSGRAYRYWLQEIELDGSLNDYGPVFFDPALPIVTLLQPLPISDLGGIKMPAAADASASLAATRALVAGDAEAQSEPIVLAGAAAPVALPVAAPAAEDRGATVPAPETHGGNAAAPQASRADDATAFIAPVGSAAETRAAAPSGDNAPARPPVGAPAVVSAEVRFVPNSAKASASRLEAFGRAALPRWAVVATAGAGGGAVVVFWLAVFGLARAMRRRRGTARQ